MLDKLLINEIAPRPHNSGHYTIDACPLSQFDTHLRAILDLPIPKESTRLINPSIMVNILGGARQGSHFLAAQRSLSVPGAMLHLYGKGAGRPGRKMGHVTVLADSMEEAQSRIDPLVQLIDQIRAERKFPHSESNMKLSDPSLPSAALTAEGTAAITEAPLVAVTMGSDSDRFVLKAGIDLLKELRIPHIVTITSAHRTPDRMFKFSQEAASRGIKVIIAAAGGAAHLPGMIAALTPLPVIGVPVKGSVLDGYDSLLSIVQMPVGVHVSSCLTLNSKY